MADLFTDDLSTLNLDDLENFLGLKLPENQRPSEGTKIDFKESLPGDIGNDVAALLNTYGGLLFVGIKSDKKKQNIPVAMSGAEFAGGDIKARITDMVLSTVQPRPQFEIAILPLPVQNRFLALIRVREGGYPPYEFNQGATVRIPKRIQDTNRQATVREIEDLIAKRGILAKPASDFLQPYRIASPCEAALTAAHRPRMMQNWQRIILAPRVSLQHRMDFTMDRNFEGAIRFGYGAATNFQWSFRRAGYYIVATFTEGPMKSWELWNSGALKFQTELRPQEPIGDLAANIISMFRTGQRAFRDWGYFGTVALGSDINCQSVALLAEFPPPGGYGDYDLVDGIQIPESKSPFLPSTSEYTQDLILSDLENPSVIVATAISNEIRETCGARVRFEKLLEATNRLASEFGDS